VPPKSQVSSFEYPVIVPVWAQEIRLRRCGPNLFIRGLQGPYSKPVPRSEAIDDVTVFSDLPFLQDEMKRSISQDLLRPVFDHLQLKGTSAPAHVQFANAKQTDQLIDFSRTFGPVNASVVSTGFSGRIRAVQDLKSLMLEQEVFSSLVQLLSAVQTLSGPATEIASKLMAFNHTPEMPISERQRRLRSYEGARDSAKEDTAAVLNALHRLQGATMAAGQSGITGFWQEKTVRGKLVNEVPFVARQADPEIVLGLGHELIQDALNYFPPILVSADGRVVECPRLSAAGIRPALYYMLRLDYLQGRELAFCADSACGRVFTVLRMGARWCSPRCSGRNSNRKYWQSKGKSKRRARKSLPN
jgi:hypothetical protein